MDKVAFIQRLKESGAKTVNFTTVPFRGIVMHVANMDDCNVPKEYLTESGYEELTNTLKDMGYCGVMPTLETWLKWIADNQTPQRKFEARVWKL